VLLDSGNGPSPSWRILECEPDLDDCQSAAILPVELPAPDPGNPVLQYRVPHVTRDGEHFVWTEVRERGPGNFLSALGRLQREADRYVVSQARVIAPPLTSLELGDDAGLWQRFTANYEAKDAQLRGGRDYLVAATAGAGHYDDLLIDLASGEVRRLTRHPDHDEDVNFSPDEEWMVLTSARGNRRVEFLGLLPRPPFVDGIAFSVHFVGIAGAPQDGLSPGTAAAERDCYAEPWLLDRYGERGDYLGQELLAPDAEGWEPGPEAAWHPDGTKLVLVEARWKRLVAPGETPATRVRVARLVTRAPLDPAAVVPAAPTPEPSWAVPYEDWILPGLTGATVIPGLAAGTATLTSALPTVLSGEVSVAYDGYSDDGERFLDGFERLAIPSLILAGAEYEVDLRLRGAERGSMRGAISYDFQSDVNTGEVVTRLGRRRAAGPRTCEAAGVLPDLLP
jgi:hypothetical protein